MSTGIRHYLSPTELHSLGRLVLQSRYVVEGTLAGRHRSPLRGISSEFADHRPYIVGDDPRHVDWKVQARTERYYVRRYQDETNLRVYLVVDRSASMGYASGALSKYEFACRLAIGLGYVVVKSRDAVGLYLYSDRIDAVSQPRNSMLHLNNLAERLREQQPASTTDTADALHRIAGTIHRRALVILLSDLLDDPDRISRALAHFRRRNHDVILMQTLDPMELKPTFAGGVRFQDLETGEAVVADPRAMASEYADALGTFLDRYRQQCLELNIDYRLVRTDQSPLAFTRAYLEARRRRR